MSNCNDVDMLITSLRTIIESNDSTVSLLARQNELLSTICNALSDYFYEVEE